MQPGIGDYLLARLHNIQFAGGHNKPDSRGKRPRRGDFRFMFAYETTNIFQTF